MLQKERKNEICKENGGQYTEDGFLPNETISELVHGKPQDKRVKHNDCKCNKYRKLLV